MTNTTTVPCPACGNPESRVVLTAGDYHLGLDGAFHASRCARCGLLFQNPRLDGPGLARHYPGDYGPYIPQEVPPPPALSSYLKRRLGYNHLEAPSAGPLARRRGAASAARQLIPRFVPGGALLEIGCASGARLSLLKGLGWTDCSGIEFSASAAARARARGFPVTTESIEQALEAIPDGSLDAVIAGFVMEHLDNPFAVARRIAAKLRPGGQFLFSTVVLGAPDFPLYGRFWHNLDLPRHRVFFRKEDILRMVDGPFEVETFSRLAAPQDYTASAAARLRYGTNDKTGVFGMVTRAFDRLVVRAGNRIFPLCVLLARLGLSSRVAVSCRKPGAA